MSKIIIMKEKIMAKLFNNEELTSEEMVFIGRNLTQPEGCGCPSLPFDHSKSSSIEACSVTEDDFNELNKVIETSIKGKTQKAGLSEFVEKLEEIAAQNPKYMRIIMMNHVRMLFQQHDPLLGLLLALGGRR